MTSPIGTSGSVSVGTSGWQYRDWRGELYPRDLPTRSWLEYYAERFPVVEVNNTFYRLPERTTFERWAASTPADFGFVVKASRYLTHVRRLREPDEPVERLLSRARSLGDRLRGVLVQLPPTLERDAASLARVLAAFGKTTRVALEPRHPSWFVTETYDVLRRHDAALCLTDRQGPASPLVRTADWCYLRFHEGLARPRPCYGRAALASWVQRLHDLYGADPEGVAFFNNDVCACAPRNALTFARLCASGR
jgi:uncharacterized protein YecE (DUF72 family)